MAIVFVAVLGNFGCQKVGSFVSPFTVDYNLPHNIGGAIFWEVTVKGPAAKLAVIVVSPSGESTIETISEEEMISNSQTVKLEMRKFEEGTWVLKVKTFAPERVVWQKEVPLSMGELFSNGLQVGITSFNGGYMVKSIIIFFQKTGDLPTPFYTDKSQVNIAGENYDCYLDGSGIIGQKAEYEIRLARISQKILRPGSIISVSGQIMFGPENNRKPFALRGSFVVPPYRYTDKAIFVRVSGGYNCQNSAKEDGTVKTPRERFMEKKRLDERQHRLMQLQSEKEK